MADGDAGISGSSASVDGHGGAPDTDLSDPANGGNSSRPGRRAASWAMVAGGVAILLATGWVGWRAYQAYSGLTAASAEVTTLQAQLKDVTNVDADATAATVDRLQVQAAGARSAVDDPIYRAFSALPLLGPNLDAVRQVTVTVDTLAVDVMPSLVEVARSLRPAQLAPQDGVIDLEPIIRNAPLLQTADTAVNRAREQLAGIDRSAVVQPVGNAVLTLWRKLDDAAEITDPAARIGRLLPPMLGAQGPRTYLVVFQNPAELRATGGIFGSFAVVTADQGRITIADQGASQRTMPGFDQPVADLSAEDRSLYSDLMARYPQDVNFTPDFPTAAELFQQMYESTSGQTVDGVLAIDPVALSYLLADSLPIDVGEGVQVTSDNLVSILLSTAYEKYDSSDQSERDAFLANATSLVFSSIMSGDGGAPAMVQGLRKAISERRVLIYSADPAEQADIADTKLSGIITSDPAVPTIGVFLNDSTSGKLGYYLTNEVHVTPGQCRPDGRRELQVRVVMAFDAPTSGLTTYVTGGGGNSTQYALTTRVMVFAPAGGGVVDATQDGVSIGLGRGVDQSREVGSAAVRLEPKSDTEVVFTVLGPAGGPAGAEITPVLELTPGVHPWVTSVDPYTSCSQPVS